MPSAMTTGNCYRCGRPGHWASQCDASPCPQCRMPLDWHTAAGMTECAWRGEPCQGCRQPPHPDGAPGRCESYAAPGDTGARRELRAASAWLRDADPGSFYARPRPA